MVDCAARLRCGLRCRAGILRGLLVAWVLGWFAGSVSAQINFELPERNRYEPIAVGASRAWRWSQESYEVWVLSGNCSLVQGASSAGSQEMVLWVRRGGDSLHPHNQVVAYLEGNVQLTDLRDASPYRLTDRAWLGEFESAAPVEFRCPPPAAEPAVKPPVFQRALAYRQMQLQGAVQPAQFGEVVPVPAAGDPLVPIGPGVRRLRGFPRSSVKVQAQTFPGPDGNEWITAITSGINLVIDGVDELGSVDIAADRMVIWSAGLEPDLTGQSAQADETPLEIYMEGNIVFRQGDRVVYADRMYYDVRRRIGTVLRAELLTPAADYQGLVRLKADVLRQTSRDQFIAERAFVTTSRMGDPRYRLQSERIFFEDQLTPRFDPFTGQPRIDPLTGEQVIDHQRLATSTNNFVFLGPAPVFYWPYVATDLEDPTFYIRRVQVRNDSIFGTQVLTDWNMYQILGIRNPPENTKWTVSADYLSERGLGHGTNFTYMGQELFDIPGGGYHGFADYWGIYDNGNDNLGSGRSDLPPDTKYRYRLLSRHRQQLPWNFQFSGELGPISDRNFLEQYYEQEWDTYKDLTTGFELKQTIDSMSWSVSADTRVNDFFTQTEWLPRLDHYWLGQSILSDWFTWYEHSSAGYGRLRVVSTPEDPAQAVFQEPLAWEVTSSGERFITRQELDMPLNLGAVKLVPYALGELAHWGQDLTGNDLNRAYYQTGIRASLPLWSVNPNLRSGLFNVNGVAHKATFEVDASFAEATRDVTDLPLYDPLDDDATEYFRRRFRLTTFGGVTPLQFDERFYGVRSGLGSWVTSPSAEVLDDITAVRMGLRQRWQTKRGPPDRQRIIDWITFDTEAVYFPRPDEDNFGEDFGLVSYDFRWHVGDRLTLLSDGGIDFFDQGQRVFSVGAILSRPPRGNLYLGFRSLNGPFDSQAATASYSYWMSPKWVSSAGVSYDFAVGGSIGNSLALTRVGESFLLSFSFIYDAYKDNVGVGVMLEPRIMPSAARNLLGVVRIPPAGAYGLE